MGDRFAFILNSDRGQASKYEHIQFNFLQTMKAHIFSGGHRFARITLKIGANKHVC